MQPDNNMSKSPFQQACEEAAERDMGRLIKQSLIARTVVNTVFNVESIGVGQILFRLIDIRLERGKSLDVRLVIDWATNDRDNGEPVLINSEHRVPSHILGYPEYFSRFVRDCLHRLMCHEVDEMLYDAQGVRLFDPHKVYP